MTEERAFEVEAIITSRQKAKEREFLVKFKGS